MPPVNEQNQNPDLRPEQQAARSEQLAQTPETSPNTEAPKPVSTEAPRTETFNDQAPVAVPAQPAVDLSTPLPDDEDDTTTDIPSIDKTWVDAVEAVIEKDEEKPFEEENESEALQVKFLDQRFHKKINQKDES